MDDSRPTGRSVDSADTIPQPPNGWPSPPGQTLTGDATIPATSAGKPQRGFSRRKLLIGAGAGAVGLGLLGTAAAEFLAHQQAGNPANYGSVFAEDAAQIGHLLRRAGFGSSPADLPEYLGMGVSGAIERLLSPAHVSNAALEARLRSLNLDFTKPQDAIRWVLLRMIYSQRPFEEKLTLFWHGVLTSSIRKVGGKTRYQFLIQQNQLLREKGMGRFDDLMHAITIDPAMLFWLDGRLSSGKSPNENYSREMMELFTMGIGNFTQDDVHQGALALTGWVVRADGAHFVPARHYKGPVTFLGHTGPMTVDEVVRIICAHPATGMHLASRMWRFFVYDNPTPQDLKPLAAAYYQHDHSIAAMVRAMFSSPAFFSARAYRARVKSPLEFVAGSIRALGLETNATGLANVLNAMGQVPLDPPNVAGWPGDGASAAWMSTQSWITRINLSDLLVAIAAGAHPKAGRGLSLTAHGGGSVIQQTITRRKIASADDLVRYYVAVLLDNTLDPGRRAVLADALTNSPIKGGPTFTLAGGKKISAAATAEMLYLLMSLPEYQMN
ncbi:MAG: DUF1800 domain-containing protein [Nitrososphaerota archaeon]